LFIPDGYKHTFGELSSDIKQQISHRSKAMKQLQNFIAGTLPDKGAGT
jgi:XTP/dITP diphosphohydrolase